MKKTVLSLALATALFAGCGGNANEITAERAKEIALGHAGLTAEQATFVGAEKDSEDGKTVYDVEFYSKDFTEYDYEIDAQTGDIISYDADVENFTPSPQTNASAQDSTSAQNTSAPQSAITEAQAKEIALAKVPGAADADIREFKKDRDDGREEYEGKIVYNNTEYEFEINAENGEIIKWESESVHD